VLEENAAARRFERRGQRAGALRDVGVNEFLERLAFVPRDERGQHQKHTRLPFAESLENGNERRSVVFDLPLDDGWRMRSRRREVYTVARTVDFDEPFRAAADGADLSAFGRAEAFRFPLIAEGTHHLSKIVLY